MTTGHTNRTAHILMKYYLRLLGKDMKDIIDFDTLERTYSGTPGLFAYSEFPEGLPDKLIIMRKLNDSAWTKVKCDINLFKDD